MIFSQLRDTYRVGDDQLGRCMVVPMESKADREDWYTEPDRGLDEALCVVD